MSMQTNTLKNYNNNNRKEKMNNKMNKTDSKINKEEIKSIESTTNENKEEDILEITDDNSLDNERNKDLNEEKAIAEIEETTDRNYITRDESWLDFNTRILDLSIDKESGSARKSLVFRRPSKSKWVRGDLLLERGEKILDVAF